MWERIAWGLGSFYGMTGVVLGAMGAHALKAKLSPALLASYQVGARYQLLHALVLLIVGLMLSRAPSRLLSGAVVCLAVGVLCFSGSIYALTVLRWKVGLVTPFGGLWMIAGWALLLTYAIKGPWPSGQRG